MTKTKNKTKHKRKNNHTTLFVGRLINTSTTFCRPIVIYSDTSTLAQGNVGIITISWHKRLSFQISETSSILHSVLAQIRPGCQWPLPVWTSLKEALTKLPVKCTLITPISLSGDSEASKPALLLAFRTIPPLRVRSHGETSMLMKDFVCILL